jgi:hypothetical protein
MLASIFLGTISASLDFAVHPVQFHRFSANNCLVGNRPSIHIGETSEFITFDSDLEPFKDGVDQFIERALFSGPAYLQLLALLETEEYTLKKMALNILIERINHGCFQSLLKFSAYIEGKSNNVAIYEPRIRQDILHLMWYEKERQSRIEPRLSADVADIPISLKFSKLGEAYLRALCIWETDHLDKRMLTAYAMLPKPLQMAVISGRHAFDSYFISNGMPSLTHMVERAANRQLLAAFDQSDTEGDETLLLRTRTDLGRSELHHRTGASKK